MCGRELESPGYASCDLRASKNYPAGLLWQSLWQGCCPMQNLGRWVCSSGSDEVEGNQFCFQQESACLGKMSHHFHDILIHQYSPWESFFTKKFTSNCWKSNEFWIPNCYNVLENVTSPHWEVQQLGLIQFAVLLCSLSVLTPVLYIPINFKTL